MILLCLPVDTAVAVVLPLQHKPAVVAEERLVLHYSWRMPPAAVEVAGNWHTVQPVLQTEQSLAVECNLTRNIMAIIVYNLTTLEWAVIVTLLWLL